MQELHAMAAVPLQELEAYLEMHYSSARARLPKPSRAFLLSLVAKGALQVYLDIKLYIMLKFCHVRSYTICCLLFDSQQCCAPFCVPHACYSKQAAVNMGNCSLVSSNMPAVSAIVMQAMSIFAQGHSHFTTDC